MAESYDHTISGLLRKRSDMMGEAQDLRARMAVISNDIEALDRVLEALGYEGDLRNLVPRGNRIVLFYRNELRQRLLNELREAKAPVSSRELAERIVAGEGKDAYDKRLMVDIVKRVGKALKLLRERGVVSGGRDRMGRYVWRLGR